MTNISQKYYNLCQLYTCLNDQIDSLTQYANKLEKYDTDKVSDTTHFDAMHLVDKIYEQINILSEHSDIILLQIKSFQISVNTLDSAILNAEKIYNIAGEIKTNVITKLGDLL